MTIRVLRILEYEYADADCMMVDMQKWGVGAQATYQAGGCLTIRSATMQPTKVVVDGGHEPMMVAIPTELEAEVEVPEVVGETLVYLREGVDAEAAILHAERQMAATGIPYKIIDLRTTDPKTGEYIHRTD